MARKFIVPAEIMVIADDQAEAEAEVLGLLGHALDTGNEQGRFEVARLHETSDTIEVVSVS